LVLCAVFFFFFSSRRRHTRSYGDWSSDVCSSDLHRRPPGGAPPGGAARALTWTAPAFGFRRPKARSLPAPAACRNVAEKLQRSRSEERRVGKECRSRW